MDKPHYLVIDDDSCTRTFISAVFANEASISTACDGREALSLLEQHQYDVIISDVQMPHLNGLDLFTRVQTVAPEAAGKFILCTGNVTDEVVAFCSEYHIQLCAKPMMVDDIKTAVQKLTR